MNGSEQNESGPNMEIFKALSGARLENKPYQLPAFAFPIAGFRFYRGSDELPALCVGTKLILRPEPTNPYDSAAVEILHGSIKIGYVPRFCNRRISRLLMDGVALACQICRIDLHAPPWEAIAVRIYPEGPEFGDSEATPLAA